MKKIFRILIITFMWILFPFLVYCGDTASEKPVIEITSIKDSISINNEEFREYDFTKLFKITEDGKEINVSLMYIDTSKVLEKDGIYPVYCIYNGVFKEISVEITKVKYELYCNEEQITLSTEEVFEYDYTKLFRLLRNGEEIELKQENIDITDIDNKEGSYQVKCKYQGITQTVLVNVIEPKIEINVTSTILEIYEQDVDNLDLKSLFTITKNGKNIEVLDSYLTTNINNVKGTYFVICSYQNYSQKVTIKVLQSSYEIILLSEMIDIKQSEVITINFKSYFNIIENGKDIEVLDNMITSSVTSEVGCYEVTCTYKDLRKTMYVNVVLEHKIDIIKAYKELELTNEELTSYDYISLFLVYVDNVYVKIDSTNISFDKENINLESKFNVICTYVIDGVSKEEKVTVNVVENKEYQVYTKSIITYPNSEPIDYKNLFEVYLSGERIEIDINDITGSVDFSKVGTYEITLKINDKTYTSTVEVKMGAILEYRNGDKVQITLGTNKDSYLFSQDFVLIVNGIVFNDFPQSFIDVSGVDFNTLGEYTAKAKIPYNDAKLGIASVKFKYVEKEITYEVVKAKYKIEVEDEVNISTKNDLLNAIKVTIGSRKYDLTLNKNLAGALTCYVEIASGEIIKDYETHKAVLDVYVFGPNNEPVSVEVNYHYSKDVIINGDNIVIYSSYPIYIVDLFEIFEDSNKVEVDSSMISGFIDFDNPGEYFLTCNYEGVSKTVQVMIIDSSIIGTYKSAQKTIPDTTDYDDEYTSGVITSNDVSLFKINEDGTYKFGDKKVSVIEALSENDILISLNGYDYYMHIYDDILVLDPLNINKMQFNNLNRPFVFFNTSKYKINSTYIINYQKSGHILTQSFTGYSIDVFNVLNLETNEINSYGLKIKLVSKTSADSIYEVSYGYCNFNEGFDPKVDKSGSLTLDGETYRFNVNSPVLGLIDLQASDDLKYAQKTFTYVDGDDTYKLQMNSSQNFVFKKGTSTIFSLTYFDAKKQKNTVIDYENDILMLYSIKDSFYGTYAYKFKLNVDDLTMEIIDKDDYYGYYVYNNMAIFIDGYGSGIAKEDVNSFYEYPFTYEKKGNELVLKFNADSAFGKKMTFYVHDLLNILTVKETSVQKFKKIVFENEIVTKGAIIKIDKNVFGNVPIIEKEELYNAISIITKDGNMSLEQKKGKIPGSDVYYIVTNKIKFGTAGFYELVINIPFEDKIVENYFCVEILGNIYIENDIPGSYNYGLVNDNIHLYLDTYGFGMITIQEEISAQTYEGLYVITNDGFLLNAYNKTGNNIILSGTIIGDGVIFVRASGASSFSDYFTKGEKMVAGNSKYILRKFTNNGSDLYVLSPSGSQNGQIVLADLIDEQNQIYLLKLEDNNTLLVQISNWGSQSAGLVLSDGYEGTYVKEDGSTLFLDGFGNAKEDGNYIGKYAINSYKETEVVIIKNENVSLKCFVYRIDKKEYNYYNIDISLDESLIVDNTFTCEYSFICEDNEYVASTSIQLLAGGKAIITSTSAEHDNNCVLDKYNPKFISENATYKVEGNVVTIVSEGYIFTFLIENILYPCCLKSLSNNLELDSHGYFNVGTRFVK